MLIAGATARTESRALNGLSLGSDTATALVMRGAPRSYWSAGDYRAVVVRRQWIGLIAFIGLMMPHMARWLVGADHRWSLPSHYLPPLPCCCLPISSGG
ncbi:iron chelate uptake ABC transporter family permease subunit [Escherichia coli]|nr:iron chelate uptake ABC transporter family permease subunit [Escherichia coli]